MALQVVPWVLVKLGQSVFALESSHVREMLLLPHTTGMPNVGSEIRGMVTLRNRAIPVIDLRRVLGMPSLDDDATALNATLSQRAEDHRRWIAELDASVLERRGFGLTLDPHACAFGKWYDTFTTTSVVLDSHLKRFDQPHKAIHALGVTVADMVRKGQHEDAHQLILVARDTTLATLMRLFDETPKILAEMNREMLIVLSDGQQFIGVTADAVASVEPISQETIADIALPAAARANGLVTQTARTTKGNQLVLVVNTTDLLGRFLQKSAAA
ncbi:MAG: chemotaxis protein CheW [Acidobacteria bacterium]|nr:chemotaxis protein CheW [Acidobacteriota bacterium]